MAHAPLTDHPFARGPAPGAAELLAYAEGRLPPAAQHRVEQHLLADPLLRDALDGLRSPAAAAALHALEPFRPRTAPAWPWLLGAAAALLLTAAAVLMRAPQPAPPAAQHAPAAAPPAPAAWPSATELAAAAEQPETLRIGHERPALHARAPQPMPVPRDSVARLDARLRVPDARPGGAAPRTARSRAPAAPLLYLHDLKLADPRARYGNDPRLALTDAHLAARFADAAAQASEQQGQRTVAYTAFFDAALERFARNDHRGALDDLRFVLQQYPDDANALFYAGLCCYNLGLLPSARALLHRAAVHPVRVFDEEAAWYEALAAERLGDREAAQAAFARIAADGGFYAEPARHRLQH
jgi:hypothetical protein